MKDISLCKVKYCRNKRRKGRTICQTCNKRNWAQSNPLKYCFNNLKQNAKRRGKEFNLSFEDFKEFAIKTDYINKKGRAKESYTIDRKIPYLGYTKDNIQILSNSENTAKGNRDRHRIENCPF